MTGTSSSSSDESMQAILREEREANCRGLALGGSRAEAPPRESECQPRQRRCTIEPVTASNAFSPDDLKTLLERRESPCVSVYLPTHRRKTQGRPDAILYKNLLRDVERILNRDLPGPITREILERLRGYEREEFWDDGSARDGLCVFVAQGFQMAYRLPGQFPELEVVGPTFHTKPLMRFLQSNSLAYYLLALNMSRVALFEGMGDAIHEVPLRGVPLSVDHGNDEESGGSFEGHRGSRRQGSGRAHYGHGGVKEDSKADLERFFRAVARDLWKNHLRGSTRPLILAAPAQHQPMFRKVAQIPTLLESGVSLDPSRLTAEDLRAEAHRVLEPEIQRRISRAKEEYGLARSRDQGTDGLTSIARLAAAGRVKLLFVESGRRIWGILSPETGEILPGEVSRNAYDVDLLDEIAELTLVRGGEVFVLKAEDMPSTTGIAAILRF